MGIVRDVLIHVAIGVGSVVGVAIRIGHGEVTRSCPKSSMDTATPIRGILSTPPEIDPCRRLGSLRAQFSSDADKSKLSALRGTVGPAVPSAVRQAEGAGQVAFHVMAAGFVERR